MNKLEITLPWQGKRLDQALAALHPEFTRAAWKRRLDQGLVRLNDNVAKGSEKVAAGDLVEWEEKEDVCRLPYPVALEIPVIYEDEDLAVIVKPAGLTVHPGHRPEEITLAHGLLQRFSHLSTLGGEERPGIVHRLDKETSGLMVIAKTDLAYTNLQRDFANRSVEKGYEAIVHHRLAEPLHITDPLGRHPVHRMKRAVVARGREAITDVKPLEWAENFTRIQVAIVTGRTHQIRVHLAYHGYPIVGDPLYGPRKPAAKELLLAATSLRLAHPRTHEALVFKAPIPPHMERFWRGRCQQ